MLDVLAGVIFSSPTVGRLVRDESSEALRDWGGVATGVGGWAVTVSDAGYQDRVKRHTGGFPG